MIKPYKNSFKLYYFSHMNARNESLKIVIRSSLFSVILQYFFTKKRNLILGKITQFFSEKSPTVRQTLVQERLYRTSALAYSVLHPP